MTTTTVRVPSVSVIVGVGLLLILSMSVVASRVHTLSSSDWILQPGVSLMTDRMNVSVPANTTFHALIYVAPDYIQIGAARFEIEAVAPAQTAAFSLTYWNPGNTDDGVLAFRGDLTTAPASRIYVNVTIPNTDSTMLGVTPFVKYEIQMDGVPVATDDPSSGGAFSSQLYWSGTHALSIVARNGLTPLFPILLSILGLVVFIAAVGGVIWFLTSRRDELEGRER